MQKHKKESVNFTNQENAILVINANIHINHSRRKLMATNNNIPSNRHLQKSQNIFKNWLQAAIKNVLVAEI